MKERGSTVLVVDGGGRGAVLVHKYSLSPYVSKIIAIPGNDMMQINSSIPVNTYQQIKTTSIKEILEICKKEKVDLIDVVQDNAVEAGLVDRLRKEGFNVVGPTRAAGQIEWDKAWARKFISEIEIPQPAYKIFNSYKNGIDYIKKQEDQTWFIKAAGLAEGKGALPAKNNDEAIQRIKELKKLGKASKRFLIEQRLIGEEFSAFTLTDGRNYQFIGNARDYKKVFNRDKGPNTGGMGAFTSPLIMTREVENQVYEIMGDTLNKLILAGRPYCGILYLGGIVVREKRKPVVYVIEFNARWGDPEAEVLIPGIKGDLFEISLAVSQGRLNTVKVRTDNKSRVAVAGVSKGYPSDYSEVKGKQISGLQEAMRISGVKIYGAGIKVVDGKYYANGGRLFHIVGDGNNVALARQKVYKAISLINVEGNSLHYRKDIGL